MQGFAYNNYPRKLKVDRMEKVEARTESFFPETAQEADASRQSGGPIDGDSYQPIGAILPWCMGGFSRPFTAPS